MLEKTVRLLSTAGILLMIAGCIFGFIPNGYVGDPKGSQYIETNLKEADRRIAMDIVNSFGRQVNDNYEQI